jgi:hypothetical protein
MMIADAILLIMNVEAEYLKMLLVLVPLFKRHFYHQNEKDVMEILMKLIGIDILNEQINKIVSQL